MNWSQEQLFLFALGVEQRALPCLPEYAELIQRYDEYWATFAMVQPAPLRGELLKMVDLTNAVSSFKSERLFLLGLRFGLELREGLAPEAWAAL